MLAFENWNLESERIVSAIEERCNPLVWADLETYVFDLWRLVFGFRFWP
jgi:hypothetical protein